LSFIYVIGVFICGTFYFIFVGNKKVRLLAINVGAVLVALGLFEMYLLAWIPFSEPRHQYEYYVKNEETKIGSLMHSGATTNHKLLGYAATRSVRFFETKRLKEEIVYEASYTINDKGLRATSNQYNEAATPVLFFGGSFIFGEGVSDDETAAATIEQQSEGAYRVHNFGFIGYGPHQMLAILENGLERPVLTDHIPAYAFYLTIGDHVRRISGLAPWDHNGPKYKLKPHGNATYVGPFDQHLSGKTIKLLNKSLIFQSRVTHHLTDSEDEELFASIVAQSATLFENRYGGKFFVIYWDDQKTEKETIRIAKLRKHGLRVIPISNVLPHFSRNQKNYLIHKDLHPNALAHKLIGDFLLRLMRYETPHTNGKDLANKRVATEDMN
jgi:hypothetical protein